MTPFVILIAGMPRSGSTWQFNAARLILNRKHPAIFSGWCADYDPATKEPVHLVKVHTPEQVRFDYSLVLTTKRDLLECIGSSKRMGWLKDDNFFCPGADADASLQLLERQDDIRNGLFNH